MKNLSGSNVLITGGAGLIGSTTAGQLLREGARHVLLIDNMTRGTRRNVERELETGRVELVEGDIRDRDLVERLMDGMDFCFHLAALRIHQCEAEPRTALEVMIDGTFNVLEACVHHGVQRVVAASSASIYGAADHFPTRETHHPYNLNTFYGTAKVANELMLRSMRKTHGLTFNVVRYFNVYGPRMDAFGKYTEVLIRWYRKIRAGESPQIYGDGQQSMDVIYVDDVARANVLALTSDAANDVFNIASGTEITLADLCRAFLEAMGSEREPAFIPFPSDRTQVDVPRRLADVKKAREKLAFRPRVSLHEGLRRLADWLDQEIRTVGEG